MAEPLPQEGAPAPAEAASPEEAAGQFGELVTNLADGLSLISQLAAQVDPESAQGFDQLNQQFQSLVDSMSQKMGGGAPAPAGQGMASPEQGASGAVPAGPAY